MPKRHWGMAIFVLLHHQAGIKIARKNTNSLRYADDTTLMEESEEELKSLLMKVKEESETAGLKLNIQKAKIMASGPITSWQIHGETVTDFIFLGSKITEDDDCRREIKRCLLLGRKANDKTKQCIKEQRHYFANKGPYNQSHCFSSGYVWMWELDHKEGWVTINDAFELCYWKRLLRVPWTARRSNQSIVKEINLEYSLEGLILKLQYFGHMMWKAGSLEKTLMLGKIEGRRRRGWQEDEMGRQHHWVNRHEFEQALGDSEGQGSLACCSPWGCRVGHDWAAEQNDTTIKMITYSTSKQSVINSTAGPLMVWKNDNTLLFFLFVESHWHLIVDYAD